MQYFGTKQCPLSGFHGEYDINCLHLHLYIGSPQTTPFPLGKGEGEEGEGACVMVRLSL